MRLWFPIGTLMIAFGVGGCAAHTQRQASTLGPRADRADRKMAENCNENGLECVRRGGWTDAEREFRRAIHHDAQFGPAHNNLGLVLLVLGKPHEGRTHLACAARLCPGSGEPVSNLAVLRMAVDKTHSSLPNRISDGVTIQPESRN